MADITVVSLYDVLPASLKDDPNVSAMATALDNELKSVTALCGIPALYFNLKKLTAGELDHLAWQWKSDTWRDNWPIELKQSVIQSLIRKKRKKGSLAAVQDAISSLGSAGSITEWWQLSPPGEPHTFSVIASINDFDGAIPSAQMQEDIMRRIDGVKPLRSHYTFEQAIQGTGGIGFIAGSQNITYARISGVEQL